MYLSCNLATIKNISFLPSPPPMQVFNLIQKNDSFDLSATQLASIPSWYLNTAIYILGDQKNQASFKEIAVVKKAILLSHLPVFLQYPRISYLSIAQIHSGFLWICENGHKYFLVCFVFFVFVFSLQNNSSAFWEYESQGTS